jgi:mRNA-degrading endonuclease RelE of RelBE toxin-antitoxin system
MPWDVRLSARGEGELARLPRAEREAILRALRRLSSDFGAQEIAKLAGGGNRWRPRVGRWRIIMELDNASGTALGARVLARKDAYRD